MTTANRTAVIGLICWICCAAPGCAATNVPAHSPSELKRVTGVAKPGDEIVIADGQYIDQQVEINATGTAARPVVVRAQTPGRVILTGKSSLTIDGQYVTVSGVLVKGGGGDGDGIALRGTHNRLTKSAVIDSTYKFYVHLYGQQCRVDHCFLAGKTSEQPTFQVEVPNDSPAPRDLIDHNHFGHRPPLGKNGGETMRVGYSGQSMNSAGTIVEDNLFERCDGEIEIISSKSCDNLYRRNTFLNCDGMLTLRHGNRCRVEENFFLGGHVKGAGGIRVIGEDHVIVNNYIEGVEKGAFWITCGIVNSPLNGYFQAKRCTIAFNTVVDSRGPLIDLDWGLGGANRTLLPQDITFANNLFVLPGDDKLLKGEQGEHYTWSGNIAWPAGAVGEHAGIRLIDPKLARAKDGLMRPANDSPVRGAAESASVEVKTDVDGQAREGKLDVGCDQVSDAPAKNRPLTAKDVGPSWMERENGELAAK
jgi:poly(beta-D-mannuronate) lyase